MNPIFFNLKRAFHSTLRLTRSSLTSIGLTAARFDLLYALDSHGPLGTWQSTLRRALGVTAPTVSRMVHSLEELGLITRERSITDRRQRRLTLTAKGQSLLRRAVRAFINSGLVQLAVDSALAPSRWHEPEYCFYQMEDLESFLTRIRDAFGDFATFFYPWHPDD